MKPGRHAADDGSFRRSGSATAGFAAGRGALLLFVAVVLGVFLLNRTDTTATTTVSQKTTTTRAPVTTTTPSFVTTTTAVPAHPPAQVKVLAANGTPTAGVGARAKDLLAQAGYNALAPTDAKTKPVKTSSVYYTPTYDRDAAAIAGLLGLPQTAIQPLPSPATALVADTRGANVVVLVGEDVVSKLPAAAAPASTTTTAKPAATTTTAKPAGSTTTTAKPASSTTTSTIKKP